MKLRLSITTVSGISKTFGHAGPIIRIGRDPGCELALQGASGDAVSRQHAHIDLTPKGAMLTDVGSSNGTQLNGCLLDGAARLNVGDHIQMGYTGATLKVVEIDLATRSTVAVSKVSRPMLIGACATLALAVFVLVVVLLRKPPEPVWAKPPERTTPEVQKALLSLLDWSQRLGGSNADPAKRKPLDKANTSVLSAIKTQVEEEVKDADNQDVGVFFLAALDEMEPLVDFLKDRKNPNVRGVTLFALQSWLSRGGNMPAN